LGSRSFDGKTTADEVLEGIDLRGRVALVTGGSSGLGAESGRALAAHGAAVVLTGRDVAKTEGVADGIRAATGNAAVSVMELHLESPESVRAFAKAFLARHPVLHLLLANAGVMACPLARTREGHELQFATNHLGHFLLAGLLAPALRAGAPSRVVAVSSAGHRFSPVVFDDVHFERRPYDKWSAYGQAKTANVLFAVEWDRREGPGGVRAFAIHPGMIPTELGRHLTPEDIPLLRSRAKEREESGRTSFKTIPQGAATQLYAATAPELDGRGGLYLEDCQVSGVEPCPGGVGCSAYALDPDAAARLWSLSEETVGERFDGPRGRA
jgi:NAD(P)-dependent dehydrogenase (short-subunit alcohol dehydrogenase family)